MAQGALIAAGARAGEEVVPAFEYRALQAQVARSNTVSLANVAPKRYLQRMAKKDTVRGSSKTGRSVIVRTVEGARSSSKVKFGSVVVTSSKPTATAVRTNVERSTKALERVSKHLMKPGVSIRPKKDVPRFSASEGEPGVFIRHLNGRAERGRLVQGTFHVIE